MKVLYSPELSDALEATGEKVINPCIYYPEKGMLCEIGCSDDADGNVGNDQHCDEKEDWGKEPITLDEKNCIALSVATKVFDDFAHGEKRVIGVDVDQDSYEILLENFKGHLILCCDEMPSFFFSCYFWNKGVFPYVVKKDLQYVILLNEDRGLILRITGHSQTVKQRYTFKDDGSLVSDVNGDACIWTILFEVEECSVSSVVSICPKGYKPKTYLLRWNPAISSFKLDDYREATTKYIDGFGLNWSVYEWEEAHEGDFYYMLRTGDENAGIVFRGVFTSEPYRGEDWAGKGKKRYYMDMDCYEFVSADEKPPVDIEILEKAIPEIDWRRGHSGQLLSDDAARILDELWNN